MQQPNKSEQLAMRLLEGARDRAKLKNVGDKLVPVAVLRAYTLVRVLKLGGASLIHYELDYAASVPHWPAMHLMFEDVRLEISERVL